MKTIIAGSRTIENSLLISDAAKKCGWKITEVVCGEARGVDLLGKMWARNQEIPVKSFPANWSEYGRKAGFLRNEDMAKYADALILVWDGESKGSKMMLDIAKKKGLKIYELVI